MKKKTKKQKKEIRRVKITFKKFIAALVKDVSYNYGGWLFFISRLIWNSIILYYFLGFIKAFFLFAFKSQGIIPEKNLEVVGTILWAIGILYMISRIGTWKITEKDGGK